MIGALLELGNTIISGVTGHFKKKQELKQAVIDNRIKLAQSAQSHNQDWEMRQLENAGWKDEVLFLAVLGVFVWSGIDPDGAAKVFKNWQLLPEWFLRIVGWLVASILGVKKVGDYLPGAIKGVKDALKSRGTN